MLDPERDNEYVFVLQATAATRRRKPGRDMSNRRVHLGRTATPVLAPIMENGVEPVVPTRADLVVGYLEVLLAPEVHTAERQHTAQEADDKMG